jgi:preprotein translocase subunit SecA
MQTAMAAGELESQIQALSDEQIRTKTDVFKESIANGTDPTQLLPEVFSVVREAARRNLEMRHYDVQLVGGNVLFEGKIAEMATGEGKTLMATLAAYLVFLTGRKVHLITVNDCWGNPGGHGHLRRRTAGDVRLRYHLRHQQRIRL